jgi:hypothetical protein
LSGKTDRDGDFALARAIEEAQSSANRRHILWDSIVSRKAVYVREDHDAHIVCHPTKALRRIGKRRLGERIGDPRDPEYSNQKPFRTEPRPISLSCKAQIEKESAIGINPKYYATRSWRRQTGSQARWERASKLWDEGKKAEAVALVSGAAA